VPSPATPSPAVPLHVAPAAAAAVPLHATSAAWPAPQPLAAGVPGKKCCHPKKDWQIPTNMMVNSGKSMREIILRWAMGLA